MIGHHRRHSPEGTDRAEFGLIIQTLKTAAPRYATLLKPAIDRKTAVVNERG